MLGAVLIALVMVLVVPVAIMFGGAIWSAFFGWLVCEDVSLRNETAEERGEA